MLEEVGDLLKENLWQLFIAFHILVERVQLVDRHHQELLVHASFVFHDQDTKRAAAHHGTGHDGCAVRQEHINRVAELPDGTHNARAHRDGVLFNDTAKDFVRFVPKTGSQRAFKVPEYPPESLTHTDLDDSRIARQAFGRGLCAINDSLIAAGSSPSTITLHDLDSMKTMLSINLSMDVRNAIHGLEVWPFDELPE